MDGEKRLYVVKTVIHLPQVHFIIAESEDEAQGIAEELELDEIRTEGAEYIDNALESEILGSESREMVLDLMGVSTRRD